jgi:hypothetical protein
MSDGLNGNGEEHALPPGPAFSANAFAERKSGVNGLLHGVKSDMDEYTPHDGGVVNAACAPPLKIKRKCVNGNAGVPLNVVVNWPVASFRLTFPISFKFTSSADAATKSCRFGGLDCSTYTNPSSLSGKSGVSISTVPTLESEGHDGKPVVPMPSSENWQAPNPFAWPGLITIPAGNVTFVSCSVEVASAFSLVNPSPCGTLTSTVVPEGVSANVLSGATVKCGVNDCNFSQPANGGSVTLTTFQFGSLRSGDPSGCNRPA